VALVNTLVVTTVERRRVLRLLGRVGATRGQVAALFGWQVVFVAGTGLVAGAAAGAVTLLTVTRAVTGNWTPFIPLVPAAGLVVAGPSPSPCRRSRFRHWSLWCSFSASADLALTSKSSAGSLIMPRPHLHTTLPSPR
jgi:ABC-type antimicrobial peptide transport system permease subunit